MHPIVLNIGSLKITSYGVMLALGLLVGFGVGSMLARKRGWGVNFCSDFLFWMIVAGVLGARLAYVISDYRYFLEHPLEIIRVDKGGLIYYGGFVGACSSIYLFAKSRRESPLALYDLALAVTPLVHMFGRVGCFLNGCCFGRSYDGPLCVRFPHGSLAWAEQWRAQLLPPESYYGASLCVYPVQLYEAGLNLALFFFLMWVYSRNKRNGVVAGLYLIGYPTIRFFMEFLRGDERMRWFGYTVAQDVSMLLFLLGCIILWHVNRVRSLATENVD
ncbi:MAG: prolipoprotein diacylglyceryl transferase [Lentisphaerae bacterium]|nr:prolipoprotein diacylglyceryl transferase [Lentisphaerota bacterium]